jgi:hypothetical protein
LATIRRWPALLPVTLTPRPLDPFWQRINHALIRNGALQFPKVKGRIAKSAPDKLRKLPSQQLSQLLKGLIAAGMYGLA